MYFCRVYVCTAIVSQRAPANTLREYESLDFMRKLYGLANAALYLTFIFQPSLWLPDFLPYLSSQALYFAAIAHTQAAFQSARQDQNAPRHTR